jgi:hypothetical protein
MEGGGMKNSGKCGFARPDICFYKKFAVTKILSWCFSPYRMPIILTIIFFILFYNNYLLGAILVLLFILIDIVISVISLVFSMNKKPDNPLLIKLTAKTVFAVAFPLLTIALIFPNRWTIDFACTSTIVHMIEPVLIQQIHKIPNKSFKFYKFYFGQVMGRVRWVVYDESDQVLLAPENRSYEWWLTTGEDKGYDKDCLNAALKIHSHFFIQYNFCI